LWVNPVNANVTGTYTVTYNVSDAVGNPAVQVSRTVIVQDTMAPVPDVASLADVTGQCSASVTAPTATDACDGSFTATTTGRTGRRELHHSINSGITHGRAVGLEDLAYDLERTRRIEQTVLHLLINQVDVQNGA